MVSGQWSVCVCVRVQECAQLSKELTELQERLSERDDEISELKAERNNTRVSQSVSQSFPSYLRTSPRRVHCHCVCRCWNVVPVSYYE